MTVAALPVSIKTAAAMLRSGQLSAVELLQEHLRVIERREPTINAFITVCTDEAMAAAKTADSRFFAGEDIGLLQGIPIALKDNIDTAGVRTTVGSGILADNVPEHDAVVVQLLKRAGAVLVGKTNLHEFTLGGTTINPYYGTTRNPWDSARFVAGSSGGSAAAVAAGECLGALGTDTSGSVRMPAAMTGITGLRPTFGLVSIDGAFPLSKTVDAMGPMARSVDDVAALLAGIAPGHQPSTVVESLCGVTVGVLGEFATTRLAPGVGEMFMRALDDLADLGAHIVVIAPPPGFERFSDWRRVRFVETEQIHRDWFPSRADEYGADVREVLEAGAGLTENDYREARDFRAHITTGFLTLFEEVDLIATPTVPFVATPVGQDQVYLAGGIEPLMLALLRYATIASCIGAPAISLPCGLVDGLPTGLQLMARPHADTFLLDVARAYESVNNWQLQLPPIWGV